MSDDKTSALINQPHDSPVSDKLTAFESVDNVQVDAAGKNAVIARYILKPAQRAATTLQAIEGWEVDSYALSKELEKTTILKDGDFSCAEEMLYMQSTLLDSIFCRMIGAALAGGPGANIDTRFLELALRSQKQARQTVETLKTLREKTPPALIQHNSYMQINTGAAIPSRNGNENELLDMDNNG